MPDWWYSTSFFGLESVDGSTNGDMWIGTMVFYSVFLLFALLIAMMAEADYQFYRTWTVALVLTPLAPVVVVITLVTTIGALAWMAGTELINAWRPHD